MTEHLPLVASADQGTALFRKAILGLAIRGLLVNQDDADEPAGALLERAAPLKSSKPARLTSASEAVASAPYQLPRGWVWTTLPALAVINPRNQAEDDGEASFVPMAAIGTGFADGHTQETRRWGDIKTGFTHFAEGDIGVAKITPCFENSKACVFSGLINGIGAGTTELHVVRPLGGTLAPRYALAYLKSPWFLDMGESKMTGTAGQKRLPKDFVERHPFPLPPLAEQHRIVAKVDELMALCDRLEARQQDAEAAHARLVQALLDSLTQARDAEEFQSSWQRVADGLETHFTTEVAVKALEATILHLAVTGRLSVRDTRLPANSGVWPKVRLGDLAVVERGGSPRPIKDFLTDAPDGLNWIKIGDTDKGGKYITSAAEKIRPEGLNKTRRVYPGDFLLTNSMSFGRPYITKIEGCIHDGWLRISPTDRLDRDYLYILLSSPYARGFFDSAAAGAVVMNLNAEKVRDLPIQLPSLDEQLQIVQKVTELLTLCDQLKVRIGAARAKHAQLAEALVAEAVA